MKATVAEPNNLRILPSTVPGRRYDHLFFSIAAWVMLGSVFLDFAHSYYLAGVFRAPLPSFIVHVHGAAFSSWIILLIVQTSLVATGRTDIHRAGTDALVRGFTPRGLDAKTFYIVQVMDMVLFAGFVLTAFRFRRNAAAHKRLILIATIGLQLAAVARWPIPGVQGNAIAAAPIKYIFLIAIVAYGYWSIRRSHRATICGSLVLIAVQQIRIPIGFTPAWHSFATWMISVAR